MIKGAILPLFYLPPIEYFNKIVEYKENLQIERFEHFPKQTYRNRASIQSPNGKLDLIVPVIKGSKVHTQVKDVKISYDFNWQRLHWMSLQTSYRRSAYFEFYEDELAPFYEKKWNFLYDLNEEIFALLLKLLKITAPYSFTEEYKADYQDLADFRSSMSPKTHSSFHAKPYYQVFEDRHGFIPNLSILDLLFSQGPQSSKFI
jgi:hypothetical protein